MPEPILVAKAKNEIHLLPHMANRHGLIARAVGSQIGREIVRGVLGSLLGGGRRR